MKKTDKTKMTKDIIPDGFSLSLVLVDTIPVVFFGATMILISMLLHSKLFLIGALLTLFAGAAKVIWKLAVVIKRKNVWWLFIQMRITMPVGFIIMIIGLILSRSKADFSAIWQTAISIPAIIFFVIGFLGMILMAVFAFTLDGSKVESNWIEQITNSFSQVMIFLGVLSTYMIM